MDNSSIRGRFSLSTTNLTSPIAESTCLNGVSSRSTFNWGEGAISSRSRNISQSVVEQNSSMSKNVNSVPTKVSMSPSSRIDPRTYVDIHSNGLASRIVKYHNNSVRLNRSQSMNNLYNKPGQFPVVHLKKNEQYKAKKTKNLSITRIAAPEKSAFHGNTLSSILRSGSIVGLQKSDEEISRENRPILHPPPTENEMAPTRSVLEVLKEISRKRINSDEMDGTELTKKQCKELEQDSTSNIIQRTQTKRQREITNSSVSNAQISPEQQVIKRRMCNYNNDIMSSLSSSMASVNKKRMLEIQSQKRIASDLGALNASKTSSTNFELSCTEKHRCFKNFEIQNSAPPVKCTQINRLASVTQQNNSEFDGGTRNGIVTRRVSEPTLSNTKPKLTLFNKDYDEVPTIVNNINADTKEDGDLCGIQFVKPKKSSSVSSGGALLMEKTRKSKLALMLSALKGELNDEDEVDAVLPKKDQEKEVDTSLNTSASNIPHSTSLFSTTTVSVPSSKPSVTSTSVVENSALKSTELTNDSNLDLITVTSTISTTSCGFKTNPIPVISKTSTTPAQVSLAAITTSAPISSVTSTITSNSVAGGFSFGISTIKTPTTATPSASLLPSSIIAPSIGSILTTSVPNSVSDTNSFGVIKPIASVPATTQSSVSSTPSFTFGIQAPIPKNVSSTKEPATTSTFGSAITKAKEITPIIFGQSTTSSLPTFSFGSMVEANTTANTMITATALTATTSASTANFNSQKVTWSSSQTSPPNDGASFGTGSLSTLPQSSANLTSPHTTGGFLFSPTSSTEATKTLFGNIAPINTTSTNLKTTVNTTTSYNFGAGPSPSAAAVPSTALTFGTTIPTAASNIIPQDIFGNAPTPQPSNTFSFGSSGTSAPSQNDTFAFSSSEKTNATIPATIGTSGGGFSFNTSSVNFVPVSEASKSIFGTAAPSTAETNPAFNFGSSINNQNADKPVVFGGSKNIFGSHVTSTSPQSSTFTFGSSTEITNHGQTASNFFGPTPTSNISSGVSPVSNSIFGVPPAAIAPLQQSSTFTFGASTSNAKKDAAKPTGGFVFGSSSSIGSNASKPAVDMNKTFAFGDGTTIIKPAPSLTNVFGGSNGMNSGINSATENKMFSFGAAAGSNNIFAAGRQTVNPAPAFNFGSVAPVANSVQSPSVNLFPQQIQPPGDRVIKKATRRLHKT